MRRVALAALLALAACHRPQADQPTPGADGEAQAKTAAKTVADLQAADAAAEGPAPEIAPARVPHVEKAKPVEKDDAPADIDDNSIETNTQD